MQLPDELCLTSLLSFSAERYRTSLFGVPDGQPTRLFFLICCQDDGLHLHVLARLCLMAQKTSLLEQLRQAPDAESMHRSILAAETEVCGQSART
jgi:hypothetical protein